MKLFQNLSITLMLLMASLMSLSLPVFADPSAAASGVPVVVASPVAVSAAAKLAALPANPGMGDLLSMLLQAIGTFKALGWQAGLSALIMLLICTMKNSAIRGVIWDKLGKFQVFAAPILSLIVVGLGSMVAGQSFSISHLWLALVTGGGAVFLYEMLDALHSVPGISPVLLAIGDFVSKILGEPPAPPAASS